MSFDEIDVLYVQYDSAVEALMSPLHQASDKESLQKSAARRILTVGDMREYWRRLQVGGKGDEETPATLPTPKRIIHITGTKGKGSTASFCQSILQEHGYSTGLFTSPHLIDIRERIRLDGRPVNPNVFGKAYWNIRNKLEAYATNNEDLDDDLPTLPGYFRMLTLMAYYIFSQLDVDVWIVEVGMGGRYDATNFLDRAETNSVCGVTLLDLDHTRVLGNTLEQIAWEKGGIFAVDKASTTNLSARPDEETGDDGKGVTFAQDGNSASVFVLDSNTEGVVRMLQACAANEGGGCGLKMVQADSTDLREALGDHPLGLSGEHQYGNAAVAVHLCHAITDKDAEEDASMEAFLKSEKTVQGLISARWPARCQTVTPPGPPFNFRLDGAHTLHSLTSTIAWFRGLSILNPRRVLVFYCSPEKNPVELLNLLKECRFTAVYFAKPDSMRPSPVEFFSARELLEEAGMTVKEHWISATRSDPEKETWQETLGIIWKHVVANLVPLSPSVAAATNARHMQHYAAPLVCNKRAMEIVKELSTTIIEPTEVLVTGSLYLVGSFLKALEWSEEPSHDVSSLLDES